MSLILVRPPQSEPVSTAEMFRQLRLDDDDSGTDAEELQAYIAAARSAVENYLRRSLVLQTWRMEEHQTHSLWRECGFFAGMGRDGLMLPFAPLFAVDFVRLVPTFDAEVVSASYVARRDEVLPGRLKFIDWAEWDGTIWDAHVQVQWRAGYGCALSGLTVSGDGLALSGYAFSAGEVGLPVTVGASTALILSVADGAATLDDALGEDDRAATDGYLGWKIPAPILHAIKLLCADMYEGRTATPESGSVQLADDALPPTVRMLLNPYRNLLS